MIRPLARGVIGCAVACGALVAGPSLVGIAIANADLLGSGGGGGGVDVLGVDVLGGKAKAGGGAGSTARVSTVSTEPSARSVVIHTRQPAAQPDPTVRPAAFTAPVAEAPAAFIAPAAEAPAMALSAPVADAIPAAPPSMPVTAPLSIPPPAAPVVGSPAPLAAPVVPSTSAPRPGRRLGPAVTDPRLTKVPDTFRVGYPEYLRRATNTDLLVAAVPGVAGIAGFTLVGAFAGYRQAKAVQQALLAPVPTSILL
jgi:hypothetical protein